jgi:hypothetical protein
MTTTIPATWPGEKRLYERQFYSTLRRRTKIIDIRPETGELGFTAKDGNIHLAYAHPVMDPLTDPYQVVFRYGVFTHETLHQVYTSFTYLEEVLDAERDKHAKKIISLYANLVEDPAIEYFAPQVFGGEMLDSLRFTIRQIYDMAPDLEESTTAFSQFINALVMFGDMGLLKGKFTYPEAEKYFRMIAPEFNAAVVNPDPKERINAAKRWTILTRPLWKKEAEEEEKFEQMIDDLLKEHSDGGMQGEGEGESAEGSSDDERSKRRDAFAKALKGEEGGGSGDDQSEDESGTEDDPRTEDESTDDATESSSGCNENGIKEEKAKGKGNEKSHSALDKFRDDGIGESMVLSDDLINDISDQIQKELKAIEDETSDTLDLPVSIPKARGTGGTGSISCVNLPIEASPTDVRAYQALVSELRHDIKLLTNSIRQILRADYDDYIRATSGRYSLKRDLSHTTVKIFDKKRERKNIDDMAVVLLIDCSGSMQGNKSVLARRTGIVLAETFAALKIPCYIMGFTADTQDAQVVHMHYVSWKNTDKERCALMQVCAYANNDDGYSIRYATSLLKRRVAEHKLLFVISDGAPACGRYRYCDGITDTALAIQEAKKSADIFGIGIGIHNSEELKNMYRGNYLNVRDTKQLTCQLARQLKRTIRSWLS